MLTSRRTLAAGLLAAVFLLSACATAPAGGGPAVASSPADPWENWNRKVYAFNDAIDRAVLKPAAEAYRAVLPSPVRAGVSNFFGNIGDVWSAANQLFQGKLQYSLEMGMRVLTNSVFGVAGVFDPATDLGLTRRSEDFGQTLGRWGVGTGPYLVLPLLGPSTVRDAAALTLDFKASASNLANNSGTAIGVSALDLLQIRAGLLSTTNLLDGAALDPYSFVRGAFLARRIDSVHDGSPPLKFDDADPGDSPPPPAKPK